MNPQATAAKAVGAKPAAKTAPKAKAKAKAKRKFDESMSFPMLFGAGAILQDVKKRCFKARPSPGAKLKSFSHIAPGKVAAFDSAQEHILAATV